MDAIRKRIRREQLDRQLLPLRELVPTAAPVGGWIKTIREALGMSLKTFAEKLDLASSSTAHQLETAEVQESITLKRLRGAADALGCDVHVVFIPRIPLSKAVENQARYKAEENIRRVHHWMVMEDQTVSENYRTSLVEKATLDLLNCDRSSLWD
jgi:predicted DNA-binding mobile mystery protein A